MGLRSAIEATYSGLMTVYRRFPKIENGRTVFREEAVYTALPCALSRGASTRRQGDALRNNTIATVQYDAKVFLAPEPLIPPGSRVLVLQDGMSRNFVTSGEPMVYPTHQEIVLSREEFA